jgi:hypothetical protein
MRNRCFPHPLACVLLALAAPTFLCAQISLSISVGPPPIPVYEQPACPDNGYTWAPGYWAWGGDGYFWVPGTWVMIPQVGMLWTPGYWGWGAGSMMFHEGYWGPHVGFYGGVNYGFGYGGSGYEGGHWQGQNFYYNRSVNNIGGGHVTNVYNQTVVVNNNSRVSFNGGQGGLSAAPTAQDRAAEQDHHVAPTAEQAKQHQSASQNKQLLASVNGGKPSVAATGRAGDFSHAMPAKAAGGQVPEAALKATPKNMAPAPKAMPAGHAAQPQAMVPQHPQAAAQRPAQAMTPQHPQPAAPRPQQAKAPQRPQPAAQRPQQAMAPQRPQPAAPRPAQARAPEPQRPSTPAPRPAPEARPAAAAHPQAEPRPKQEPHA